MIINKEVMIEAIRELGHVTVDEVSGVVLVRSQDFDTTIAIEPNIIGNTITGVKASSYDYWYHEDDHDEREYKSLVGLINYIVKHLPLQEHDIYACKNDRVAKNRFKQLTKYLILDDLLTHNHNDKIIVSTDDAEYIIDIKVENGEFRGRVTCKRIVNENGIFGLRTVTHPTPSFADLQTFLFKKGAI